MDQFDESIRKQVAALFRVISLTKCIKDDNVPCKIEEGLFLGSVGAANNKDALKALNITHVLTVASALPPAHPNDFVYKIISV
nr:isoform 2 of dual specificity protein phosphatase 1 [Quercus suber]